jgi:hypothetical protein
MNMRTAIEIWDRWTGSATPSKEAAEADAAGKSLAEWAELLADSLEHAHQYDGAGPEDRETLVDAFTRVLEAEGRDEIAHGSIEVVLPGENRAYKTSLGATVYASDEDTFTLTASTDTPIGYVARYVANDKAIVRTMAYNLAVRWIGEAEVDFGVDGLQTRTVALVAHPSDEAGEALIVYDAGTDAWEAVYGRSARHFEPAKGFAVPTAERLRRAR